MQILDHSHFRVTSRGLLVGTAALSSQHVKNSDIASAGCVSTKAIGRVAPSRRAIRLTVDWLRAAAGVSEAGSGEAAVRSIAAATPGRCADDGDPVGRTHHGGHSFNSSVRLQRGARATGRRQRGYDNGARRRRCIPVSSCGPQPRRSRSRLKPANARPSKVKDAGSGTAAPKITVIWSLPKPAVSVAVSCGLPTAPAKPS